MFAADRNYEKAFKDAISSSLKERTASACST
jgi:hypothetical protein